MSDTQQSPAKVVIVSGPSGVGKSTICKEVAKRLDKVCVSVSVTTRTQTPQDVEGQDYYFVSREVFERQIAAGRFLEHAEVFGHYYGTLKDKIDEALAAGRTVILEIDVQGAKQAKMVYPDAPMVFILPPSNKVLEQRLHDRGRDAEEIAEQRLNGASNEIAAAWQYYEHMVINEDLEQAIAELIQIIQNEPSDQ
ncbi:guanylate kinase [Planctomycetota bacterium]